MCYISVYIYMYILQYIQYTDDDYDDGKITHRQQQHTHAIHLHVLLT